MKLDLPKGRYSYEWIDPASGSVLSGGEVRSRGAVADLEFTHTEHLLALRIRRR